MANYDAEVRVSTKVDTSQMQRLQLQIDKAVQKVDALTQKYDELKNKRLPTEAYTELESKLASAKAELTALIDQEEKFKSIGATTGVAWDTLIQKEADAQLKIESLNAEMQNLLIQERTSRSVQIQMRSTMQLMIFQEQGQSSGCW